MYTVMQLVMTKKDSQFLQFYVECYSCRYPTTNRHFSSEMAFLVNATAIDGLHFQQLTKYIVLLNGLKCTNVANTDISE